MKSKLDKVCEALDCNEEATEEVKVNAGKYGIIVLRVCSKCTGKFQD